jgi:hypothetical protein
MKKTYLIFFFLAVVFFAPNASIQADDSSFLERIDYSNVDIIGLVKTKGKGDYKVRTVQPISIDENSGDTVFIQGMIGNFSQFGKYRIGTNLGIGKRTFSDDFSKLYGYNLFYDSEPDPGHHRLGVGLEYRESKFGLSNNYYKALSGKKAYGSSGMNEEALDGVDVIASGFVPQFNWIETELSLAYWDSVSASNLNEVKLGFNFNITDFLTVNIQAEDDNLNTISYNAGISFNIGGNKSHKPSLLGSYQSAPSEDMRVYNLEPVKRSEKITLEQTGGFTVKVKKSG